MFRNGPLTWKDDVTKDETKLLRTGTGTIRRFFGDAGAVVVGIDRDDGLGPVALMCDRDLAMALIREFGKPEEGSTDMQAIIGVRVEYGESAHGLLVEARVLVN